MQNNDIIAKLNHDAINFQAECINAKNNIEHIDLAKKIKDKYAILFFYPLNFTFVCPTEILSLNAKISEFKSKNVEVFGISIDSLHCHLAWKNTELSSGGIGQIDFSLISDIKKEISISYNALNENSGLATRTTVIIDPNFKIIHMSQYANHIGRNIDDYLRIIDADIHFNMYGEVCPANWSQNKPAIKPDLASTAIYLVNLDK